MRPAKDEGPSRRAAGKLKQRNGGCHRACVLSQGSPLGSNLSALCLSFPTSHLPPTDTVMFDSLMFAKPGV